MPAAVFIDVDRRDRLVCSSAPFEDFKMRFPLHLHLEGECRTTSAGVRFLSLSPFLSGCVGQLGICFDHGKPLQGRGASTTRLFLEI